MGPYPVEAPRALSLPHRELLLRFLPQAIATWRSCTWNMGGAGRAAWDTCGSVPRRGGPCPFTTVRSIGDTAPMRAHPPPTTCAVKQGSRLAERCAGWDISPRCMQSANLRLQHHALGGGRICCSWKVCGRLKKCETAKANGASQQLGAKRATTDKKRGRHRSRASHRPTFPPADLDRGSGRPRRRRICEDVRVSRSLLVACHALVDRLHTGEFVGTSFIESHEAHSHG